MPARKFKDRTLAACYASARQMAADNFSTYYYSRAAGGFGPCWPHRGAGHRNAYWNGRQGARCTYLRTSPAYAYWAAGQDDMRQDGATE
jgi:hypothetical protein